MVRDVTKLIKMVYYVHTVQAWLPNGETARRSGNTRVAVDAELAVRKRLGGAGHDGQRVARRTWYTTM